MALINPNAESNPEMVPFSTAERILQAWAEEWRQITPDAIR
jgi:hypothetical protein